MAANSALKKSARDGRAAAVAARVRGFQVGAFRVCGQRSKELIQRGPVFQVELATDGVQVFLHKGVEEMVVPGRRLDHVANVVVGVAAEPGGAMQPGAMIQQLRQLFGLSRDLTVGLDEFVPLVVGLGDLLRAPKGCGTQQKAQEHLECRRMRDSFSCSSPYACFRSRLRVSSRSMTASSLGRMPRSVL